MPNFTRRHLLAAAAALPALFGATRVFAQAFPSKPIRLIVSALPGQTADVVMRIVAEKLSPVLGQPIVIDNRPGAGSVVGLAVGARSPADGYTLIMAPSSMTISPSLTKDLSYDVVKDFAPITNTALVALAFLTRSDSPLRSLDDIRNAARANPGKVTYGSTINGTPHLAVELFAQRTGISFQHVPYKGSTQAHTDLLGGSIDFLSDSLPAVIGHIKGGKMRPVAVTSKQRQPFLPDVPTVSESGLPGFEVVGWVGLMAPAGTPNDILDKLNADVVKVLRDESVRARLYQLTSTPAPMSRSEFSDFIVKEIERYREVIQRAGIKSE